MSNTEAIARIFEIDREMKELQNERANLVSQVRGEPRIIVVGGDRTPRVTDEMMDTLNALGQRDSQRGPRVLLFHLVPRFHELMRDVVGIGVMASRKLTETEKFAVQHRCHEKLLKNRHEVVARNLAGRSAKKIFHCRPYR